MRDNIFGFSFELENYACNKIEFTNVMMANMTMYSCTSDADVFRVINIYVDCAIVPLILPLYNGLSYKLQSMATCDSLKF